MTHLPRHITIGSTMSDNFYKGVLTLQLFLLFALVFFTRSLNAQSSSSNVSNWIDLSQVDTLLDLSSKVLYYIDEAPFDDYHDVRDRPFIFINKSNLQEEWLKGADRRFWLKINISNSGDLNVGAFKLYLGTADRVFLYKIVDEGISLVAKKGLAYRKNTNPHFPFYVDFPLNIEQGDSVQLIAHMSSLFIPESFEFINPHVVKKGYEAPLYQSSLKGRQLGMVYTATLSIVFIFLVIGLLLYWSTKENALLAFSLLCLSFFAYFVRDLDVLVSSVNMLHFGDEYLSRSEPLFRTLINTAFLFFTFTYFKKFRFRKVLIWTSVFVVFIGVLSGILALFSKPVALTTSSTEFDLALFLGYIFVSLLNSVLVLGTLWFSIENYSKFYILGTVFFILCTYSGLFVEGVFPSAKLIPHFNNYTSLLGVFIFTMAMVYMIIQRILDSEKQVIIKTAEVQKLNEINTAKSEFYTNVTHEFRTPLTVIMGMAASIKKNTVEKNLIIKNAKMLLSLVNQILSLSKNREHADALTSENVDLVSYLRSIVEPLKYHAEQKYIDLILTSEPDAIRLEIDTSAIQKVINNLVYNAIKFSPPHTAIRLELKQQERYAQCVISDQGIGIEKSQIPYIFNRFYQADPSFNGRTDIGSGIGLSIVKETVEGMNGKIAVESEIGEGTRFIIHLPLKFEMNHSIKSGESNFAQTLIIPNAESAVVHDTEPRVLIIEDNEDVLLYTERCLKDKYSISTARDGKEGLTMARSELPDLILSDVMMPHMNGFELTRRLKKDIRTDHIPVVLLTAKATQAEIIEGLTAGADDYIYKPFDREELRLRVENIIEGRRRSAQKNRMLTNQANSPLPEWLTKFDDLVSSHLNIPITSEWLSKQLQLSRSQVHRKVKSLTGLTPAKYVIQIKMRHAKKILISSQDSIESIASQLGFNSASYFTVTFKGAFGSTPSQWRQGQVNHTSDT